MQINSVYGGFGRAGIKGSFVFRIVRFRRFNYPLYIFKSVLYPLIIAHFLTSNYEAPFGVNIQILVTQIQ